MRTHTHGAVEELVAAHNAVELVAVHDKVKLVVAAHDTVERVFRFPMNLMQLFMEYLIKELSFHAKIIIYI